MSTKGKAVSEQQINYDEAKRWLEKTREYHTRNYGPLAQLPEAYFVINSLVKDIEYYNSCIGKLEAVASAARRAVFLFNRDQHDACEEHCPICKLDRSLGIV